MITTLIILAVWLSIATVTAAMGVVAARADRAEEARLVATDLGSERLEVPLLGLQGDQRPVVVFIHGELGPGTFPLPI